MAAGCHWTDAAGDTFDGESVDYARQTGRMDVPRWHRQVSRNKRRRFILNHGHGQDERRWLTRALLLANRQIDVAK